MSMENKGISCVRCRSYLFSEDDVVYCPVCGAPHHRECYNALGHCALEEFHGTENEYSKKAVEEKLLEYENRQEEEDKGTVTCQMCSEKYDSSERQCPKCSAPNLNRINGFEGFDFLGGVPAEFDLGDGVTANEAKTFVMANTHRYIPKFAALNKKNKISWNWMAFLFPTGWMFARKMFKGGIIASLIMILSTILTYPLSLRLYDMGFTEIYSVEAVTELAERLPEVGVAILLLGSLGLAVSFAVSLFLALYGDYIYKNHSISTIKKIKEKSEDKLADYRKKGGTSLIWFFLGSMIVQYGAVLFTVFL